MRVAHPQQPLPISDSYGTIAKRSILNAGWESVLNTIFPNPSDDTDAIAPDLGLSQELLAHVIKNDYSKFINGTARPRGGEKSLTRILCAVQQILGIEYCPLLPDIVTMMLAHMPESYAYATVREMISDTSNFLPVCLKDHYAWCKTYYFFVKRMFPQAYQVMMQCGALTVEGLDPIFKRFFRTLLKPDVSKKMTASFLFMLCVFDDAIFPPILLYSSVLPAGRASFHGYISRRGVQSYFPLGSFSRCPYFKKGFEG